MKPRLLDLYAGAGGSAKGFQRAGFYVVGVDNRPQPRYAGDEFVQRDALSVLTDLVAAEQLPPMWQFAAIHASPPCQAFTAYTRRPNHVGNSPDLIAATRRLLRATGLPYVIENVKGAPLEDPVMLCGSMFDPPLDVQRHRYFEHNGFHWLPTTATMYPLGCRHKLWEARYPAATNRRKNSRRTVEVGVWRIPLETQKRAMGVDWDVTLEELSEMVPPAYTELIGHQLMQHLHSRAAA